MIIYHGGKKRIGMHLCEVMKDDIQQSQGYCEPFCGMLGVLKHACKYTDVCLAGDINEDVIAMWNELQQGWIPPSTCTEDKYNRLKADTSEKALRGYIGHQFGFSGQYFNGYACKYGRKLDQSKKVKELIEMCKDLTHVKYTYGDYTQFSDIKGMVIYCDPPYDKTVQRYEGIKSIFDSNKFYDWCRRMAENNIVYVSGYTAPSDFTEVYSNEHQLTGYFKGTKESKKRVEKLYKL